MVSYTTLTLKSLFTLEIKLTKTSVIDKVWLIELLEDELYILEAPMGSSYLSNKFNLFIFFLFIFISFWILFSFLSFFYLLYEMQIDL